MRTRAGRFGISLLGACAIILMASFFLPAQDSGHGKLKLNVRPNTAGVFVDGTYVGPAHDLGWPLWYALTPGEHEVSLRHPRLPQFSTKVTIEAGESTTLKHTMQGEIPVQPPYGVLRVQGGSSKYCGVFLNGKFMGHVDEFNSSSQGLKISPGQYALKVVSALGAKTEHEEKITIEADQTTHVRVGAAG